MPIELKSPTELVWNEGELPDVHSVPYNCVILAWFIYDFDLDDREYIERYCKMSFVTEERIREYNGKFNIIKRVYPCKDEWNPLQWHGFEADAKVVFWAWISKGEKKSNR